VPVVRANQRGTHVGGLLGGGPEGALAGAVALPREPDGWTVVTVSANGQVKRTAVAEFVESRQRTLQATGVRDGGEIAAVLLCRDDDHLLLAHDAGQVIRFPASEVRVMGRSAAGVAGMNVPAKARIVSATAVGADSDADVVTIAADGTAKRSPLADYPAKGRGGKGVTTGTDTLLWCGVATDLHVGGDEPAVLRPVDVPVARRAGRGGPPEFTVGGQAIGEHPPLS
jgi:DNA gyrase subunit A